MRRMRSDCCARAASGHAAAAPPISEMNSRRLIATPTITIKASYQSAWAIWKGPGFGSLARPRTLARID